MTETNPDEPIQGDDTVPLEEGDTPPAQDVVGGSPTDGGEVQGDITEVLPLSEDPPKDGIELSDGSREP